LTRRGPGKTADVERSADWAEIREALRRRRRTALSQAADAHDRAAATHERAAALFDKLDDAARAAKHRDASLWDRQRAEKARAAAERE